MPPKKMKGAPKAYKMPPPIPAGEVLTDMLKKEWSLGSSVGKGGFGEIYLATPRGKAVSKREAEHVIKIVSVGE